MSAGLLLIRLALGLTIAAHGAQKIFGVFGGHGPRGTAGFFGGLGFRFPLAMAVAAGLSELGGGLLFAGGLITPLAAVVIGVVMLTAIATVHWRNGFFNSNGGFEFPFVLWATAIAVAAIGPGRYSLDSAIGWADNLSGAWWGLAAALATGLAAAVILTLGRAKATAAEASQAAPAGDGDQAAPSTPIEIGVEGVSEGSDLLDYLGRQGFTANLVEASGDWRVEVESSREESPDLPSELADALASWLPSHADTVRLRVGDQRYTMRAR